MRLASWFAGALLATASAGLGGTPKVATKAAVVLLVQGDAQVPVYVRYTAKSILSSLFAEIGVPIRWHSGVRDPEPAGTHIPVQVRFADAAAVKRTRVRIDCPSEAALACSWPFDVGDGTKVVVMYERIRVRGRGARFFASLLAHVIAHEVAHVLEAQNLHSEDGVMKKQWSPLDFYQMSVSQLSFTEGDVELIQAGLDWRLLRSWATADRDDVKK